MNKIIRNNKKSRILVAEFEREKNTQNQQRASSILMKNFSEILY